MRDCVANQVPVWVSRYLGNEEIVSDDGLPTGQTRRKYSEPEKIYIAVATCSGDSDVSFFGKELSYDRTMTSTDKHGIDEFSLIWIDKSPADGEANYTVERAAYGLNQHVWALKKVVGA